MLLMELTLENISNMIDNKKAVDLRNIFDYYNNVDLAKIVEQLNEAQLVFVFKIIKTSIMAEIFSYLNSDSQEKIISVFSSDEISSMLNHILSDDIADFVSELPSNLVIKVLNAAERNKREDINRLLNFKEGTAGALLTAEYIELKAHNTCKEALQVIRRKALNVATISYLYIIDNNRKLRGYLKLRDIIFGNEEELIGNIMETDIISVKINDLQEDVAKIFKTYDLNALPVLNQDGCLTGIITIDDVIDVIEEEATEDIQKMAALVPLEESYLKTSSILLAKNKIIWLLILMLSGVFTSLIIAGFEESVGLLLPFLPLFFPMLMDVGGDAGSQTTTLIVRSLSLGEFQSKDTIKVLKKELPVALISGFLLGSLGFIIVLIEDLIGIFNYDVNIFLVASLLGISIFLTILLAKLLGVFLPMLASKLKIDPAVMAGPLLTTIIDTFSLLIYYSLALFLILPLIN